MPHRSLLLFALLLCGPVAFAQPAGGRLKGEAESGRTRKRLTEVQAKLSDPTPAVADELQQILDQAGDELVLVKDDQFQPARRLVHQSLAALPPKALATFRDRLEEPAKKLLDAGKTKRDPKPLRELIDRYFVSRPAEEGLLLLGELAFERGDFVAARRHWRALLPGDADGELRYPQPKTDPALVKAKLALARLMGGDKAGATADLAELKKDHPKATGPLAGTTGVYADTLAKLIDTAVPPPELPGGWGTFGGNPARDGRPPADLPRYWPSRPTWRSPIPRDGDDKARDKPKPASVPPARTLAFHPVIVGGYAYLADAGRVFRFDLQTGAARIAFHSATLKDEPVFADSDAPSLAVPNTLDADYTLTAADGVIYARLGPPALPASADDKKKRSYLVALEPKPDARNLPADAFPLAAKWQLAPPAAADVPAAWEGAPLVADGKLYAAFVRAEANKLVHAVACYPTAGGKPHWVVDVAEADGRAGPKHRNELLTLAGANVVFCTHTGVTVAVSAATGKPAWAFRNPPAERPPQVPARDLCPAVYADGRVFLAPADGDAVYALDADTGRKLWAVPGLQVEHLLGVSRGNLIATLHGPDKGVRGFDAATGGSLPPDGWRNHDDGKLSGYGRGVAGPNLILVPVKGTAGEKFNLLDPATGSVARQPVNGVGGNVIAGSGVVLVATPTELLGYLFDDGGPVIPKRNDYPLLGAKDPPKFDPAAAVAAKPAFDPQTAPGITALDEKKSVALPPLALPLVPLNASPDAPLVLCDGKTLFAVSADTGKPLWDVPLGSPANFTRVAHTSDGRVLALGEFAISAAQDGKRLWEYRVPEADPPPSLSGFTFAGNRLVAKLGPRAVAAFDLGTGKLAWVADASGGNAVRAFALDGAPKFGPHLGVVGKSVFVQRGGEAWELDAASGEKAHSYPGPLPDWTGPPTGYKGKAVLPAVDGTLTLAGGGESQPLFDPGRKASRTGAPAAARAFGSSLVALVERNIGDEAATVVKDRLVVRLLPPNVDLQSADADEDRLYLPAGNVLVALSKETLREAWRSTLPELPDGVTWRITAGRTTVVAYPTAAIGERRGLWDENRRLTPLGSPLLNTFGALAGAFDAATRYNFPVILMDADTGKQTHRADVPALGPQAAVLIRPDAVLVATSGRAVWLGRR